MFGKRRITVGAKRQRLAHRKSPSGEHVVQDRLFSEISTRCERKCAWELSTVQEDRTLPPCKRGKKPAVQIPIAPRSTLRTPPL